LTRLVALRLQRDFTALYDHLVDRDVTWEHYEERGDRKSKMVRNPKGSTPFRPDSDNLPMTVMMTSFDDRHEYLHIPHPYPLLPASMPVQYHAMQSILSGRRDKALEKRTALAYHEASNVTILPPDRGSNELLDQFINFEKTDQLGEVDPVEARKGRWILLYGILQILADIATDTPNMWCKSGVSYFLNTRLKGTPPWKTKHDRGYPEATRVISHCWTVPKTWSVDHTIGSSPLRNHRQIVITSGGIGDGTGREPTFLSSPGEETLRNSSSFSETPPSPPAKDFSRNGRGGHGYAAGCQRDDYPLGDEEDDDSARTPTGNPPYVQTQQGREVDQSGYMPPTAW
jgi:hypothetical protein